FGAGGRDVIDVSAYLKAGIKVTVQDVGDDTVISLGSENSITLVGIDAQHLSSNAAGFVYS
ncbi:MAG: hypothetical protein Q7T84_00995, partial [Phenylobacterium sp.]|uniref:hypothetical protein n=1 Tax=Phenylobacterium sp. TaxID=1871053 RepID=UPI002723F7C4